MVCRTLKTHGYQRVRRNASTIENQIAEGEKELTRYTASGTHQGEFFGLAPTGNRIEMAGISFELLQEGRLVKEWPR
jgi:predicted ester cyclase